MNKEVIDFIKYLYYDDNLTNESIDKAIEKLEKDLHLTKYEVICDFENDLYNNIRDFKTEILDQLLILLSQLKDIKEIEFLYNRLKNIQSILKKYIKLVSEAEAEAIDAKDIEEEKEQLNKLYGYKPQPDELPIYRC